MINIICAFIVVTLELLLELFNIVINLYKRTHLGFVAEFCARFKRFLLNLIALYNCNIAWSRLLHEKTHHVWTPAMTSIGLIW